MTVRALLLAFAVALVAAPAHAGSIAYVKDGDVWLVTPDGARQQRVTTGGGYSYVSQADTGVMIALAPGERLHRLSRTGKVLADFTTMVSDGAPRSGPVTRFHGPFTPEISPDGSKVAFEWFNDSYDNDPGCSETSEPPCYVYSQRQGVAVSHADRETGPEEFGLLTGWIFPHWMGEDVLLRSYSGGNFNDDAVFTRVGRGKGDDEVDPWFHDPSGYGVDDVELSRDLTTVVGVAGQDDEELRVYRTLMHPYGAPDWDHRPFADGNQPVAEHCFSVPTGGKPQTPSLSPDGRALAYADDAGIHVLALPGFGAGCAQPAARAKLVVAGGRHPDWGTAAIPPEGEYRGVGGGGSAKPGAFAASASARRLRRVLRDGVAVRVTAPGPGRVGLRLRRGGRRIASVATDVAGSTTLRLRIPRARRAGLARLRRVTLTVRASFRPAAGGATRHAKTQLRLRR